MNTSIDEEEFMTIVEEVNQKNANGTTESSEAYRGNRANNNRVRVNPIKVKFKFKSRNPKESKPSNGGLLRQWMIRGALQQNPQEHTLHRDTKDPRLFTPYVSPQYLPPVHGQESLEDSPIKCAERLGDLRERDLLESEMSGTLL